MFTSGTTGLPKAIAHSHAGLTTFIAQYAFAAKHGCGHVQLPAREVFLCMLPLYHISGVTALYALTAGGEIVLMNGFDMKKFLGLIRSYGVTRTTVPQTVLTWMTKTDLLQDYDLSSLVEVAYGGSPIGHQAVCDITKRLSCALTQAYGSTEVAIVSTLTGVDHLVDPATGDLRAYSVGKPLIGVDIRILGDSDEPLPAGASGEIWVMSPGAMEAKRNAWVATGDMGHFDENGFLYIDGRKDDLIISGGENVYPAEI